MKNDNERLYAMEPCLGIMEILPHAGYEPEQLVLLACTELPQLLIVVVIAVYLLQYLRINIIVVS